MVTSSSSSPYLLRGPSLSICNGGVRSQPVSAWLLVSGYRWSSCPGGSAPWYWTSSWETFRYSRHSKNRDPVLVSCVRTSCCYCPLWPSISWLCRLAPYCFNTAATPSATPPSGVCLLLIAWLDDHGCVRGCLCLYVESSYLQPLSLRGYATPTPHCSGGPGDRLPPATHSHKFWVGYWSPSGVCAPLGFAGYMRQVNLPLVYGAILWLCPACSWAPPPFQRNEFCRGLWVGGLQVWA